MQYNKIEHTDVIYFINSNVPIPFNTSKMELLQKADFAIQSDAIFVHKNRWGDDRKTLPVMDDKDSWALKKVIDFYKKILDMGGDKWYNNRQKYSICWIQLEKLLNYSLNRKFPDGRWVGLSSDEMTEINKIYAEFNF